MRGILAVLAPCAFALKLGRVVTRKPIVILRAGDPAPPVAERRGQFHEWIARVLGDLWPHGYRVVDVRTDEPLPAPHEGAAFVMTGSSSSVTERAPWMLRAEAHLRALVAARAPYFGICFGHQMLAQALGGHVDKNPLGREIGTVRVRRLAEDAIFEGVPPEIDVNATHVDSVIRLPEGARVLASSRLEPRQAFAVGEHARAVQFHPEFDGDVMRGYVRARAHLIAAEGGDAEGIHARSGETPHGEEILRNFVKGFVPGAG
jgi:GMP synthase (glutamine-hydrolysing)